MVVIVAVEAQKHKLFKLIDLMVFQVFTLYDPVVTDPEQAHKGKVARPSCDDVFSPITGIFQQSHPIRTLKSEMPVVHGINFSQNAIRPFQLHSFRDRVLQSERRHQRSVGFPRSVLPHALFGDPSLFIKKMDELASVMIRYRSTHVFQAIINHLRVFFGVLYAEIAAEAGKSSTRLGKVEMDVSRFVVTCTIDGKQHFEVGLLPFLQCWHQRDI